MSFFTTLMHQTITYWGSPVPDGYGGNAFAIPITLTGRWQDKKETFVDSKGEEAISSAVVYTEEALNLNGYLYLGTSVIADPTAVDGARKIQQTGDSPNLSNDTNMRKSWL